MYIHYMYVLTYILFNKEVPSSFFKNEDTFRTAP